MIKREKIGQNSAIVLSVFIVAVCVALICVAGNIYYSNRDTDGYIFTRELVGERLKAFIAPFVIAVLAIAAGVVFPVMDARAKIPAEHTAKLLQTKLSFDGDGGEEYNAALAQYRKLNKLRIILWSVTGAVLLACVIATLVYMCNSAHFVSENITDDMLAMVKNVLPWIAVLLTALVAAAILSGVIAKRRVVVIKTLIKHGSGSTATAQEAEFIANIKKVLSNNVTLWVVRGIVFAVGVTFLVIGILNGGAHDVLIKAINICTECIGLG